MPYGKFDYRVLLHTAQQHVMEAQHILAVAAFIFWSQEWPFWGARVELANLVSKPYSLSARCRQTYLLISANSSTTNM